MKVLVGILFLCVIAGVSAAPASVQVQGDTYYVVTADDAASDTGNEVCAQVGQSCVGYTYQGPEACLAQHPSANTVLGVSGDASGVYCNGAPQSGVCANEQDTCHVCPTCTTLLTCSEEIGGLYKEMYVECSATCPAKALSKNTKDFINEIPQLNGRLQTCPWVIQGAANTLLGNGKILIKIRMKDGSVTTIVAQKTKGKITSIKVGLESYAYLVNTDEASVDALLQANNVFGAFSTLYQQGKIKIQGGNFFASVRTVILKPVVSIVTKKAQTPLPPPPPAPNCGQIGEQCNNRACYSGVCGAPKEQNADGRWGFWNHRCIDQNDYNANCVGRGNTPPAWQCYVGACK